MTDRDETTRALIAKLEEAEAEGKFDVIVEQARAEGRDLETLVARIRERLQSTNFDKNLDDGEDISDAVDWPQPGRPNIDEKFASAFTRARSTVPDDIDLGIGHEDVDEGRD